ncbi:2-oxoglutarate-Fe(II) type oxidoreductase hxnY-like [Humulus lupulus]|uniref:2-oxoglutarate-Fe(II) type oxidoreductase hxnY-like n=1 Tax=Humulus lupulus TaxID=3486 RepID=UPI002B40EEEE|nr:2-oxoglutarate-Fe(II) type oxidoreductase hxnY-like [Humulus lupulus]
MTELLKLPIVDLSSPDRSSTAASIRQACTEHGFFYLVNHGVEEELLDKHLEESKKFFSLPLEEKMKLAQKENRGYTPLYGELLDTDSDAKGDPKEYYYIGPLEDDSSPAKLNQWPSQEILPSWRPTMETYYRKVSCAGKRLLGLIALSLNLDENFFEKIGGLDKATAYLRLLHYPGELGSSDEELCGASAHSDYGTITLLASDGVPGLQICREKFKKPWVWEDVLHLKGAFIVNIGDLMERWTNCLFRSTLHRVMPVGQERYSAALFLDPKEDCLVECIQSCCSESCPPRYPPIQSGDYFKERFRLTIRSEGELES